MTALDCAGWVSLALKTLREHNHFCWRESAIYRVAKFLRASSASIPLTRDRHVAERRYPFV